MATTQRRPSRILERAGDSPESAITFGREVCNDLAVAERREWLVTKGIGGFAAGTVSGNLTRRYHGLLIAALNPPVGRTQLVAKVDEVIEYVGASYSLAANRWSSGAIEPHGYVHIQNFRLEGTVPVWQIALGEALLEKRIWMRQGENTTYVQYQVMRCSQPLHLRVAVLVNYRDYHSTTHAGDWQMNVESLPNGVHVHPFEGAVRFKLLSARGHWEPRHEWHRGCFLPQERYRGLDDHEDHLNAATFGIQLSFGESVTLVFSTEPNVDLNGERAEESQRSHDSQITTAWRKTSSQAAKGPASIQQLVHAADQFIVKRPLPDDPQGCSIIAGYPWFADWGRDTMIAVPGLTLATGRREWARDILLTFARFVDRGMLPNVFPGAGDKADYNTVDAALWFFEAWRAYAEASGDHDSLIQIFPVLAEIVDWHLNGTRYGIRVDPDDGLLRAGEPGVQLTWMDAKVGDWVATPRIGKPVEINALWYNALCIIAHFAEVLGRPADHYCNLAQRVRESFARFGDAQTGGLCDVIDGPSGGGGSVRPNQILAVSLPYSPLTPDQQKRVVMLCGDLLMTSYGLRSLSADHPDYKPHYTGDPWHRDGAYHQGTVWAWLLGHYALAEYRVHGDAELALHRLGAMRDHLFDAGLGTVSEIFEAE